jgi:hypothetical protein
MFSVRVALLDANGALFEVGLARDWIERAEGDQI